MTQFIRFMEHGCVATYVNVAQIAEFRVPENAIELIELLINRGYRFTGDERGYSNDPQKVTLSGQDAIEALAVLKPYGENTGDSPHSP